MRTERRIRRRQPCGVRHASLVLSVCLISSLLSNTTSFVSSQPHRHADLLQTIQPVRRLVWSSLGCFSVCQIRCILFLNSRRFAKAGTTATFGYKHKQARFRRHIGKSCGNNSNWFIIIRPRPGARGSFHTTNRRATVCPFWQTQQKQHKLPGHIWHRGWTFRGGVSAETAPGAK